MSGDSAADQDGLVRRLLAVLFLTSRSLPVGITAADGAGATVGADRSCFQSVMNRCDKGICSAAGAVPHRHVVISRPVFLC